MTAQDHLIVDGAEHVRGNWTPERQARVARELRERTAERSPRRWLVPSLAIGATALATAVVVLFVWPETSPEQPVTQTTAGPKRVVLDDGSTIEALDEQSQVAVEQSGPTNVVVRLQRGGSRFRVTPNKQRQFIVRTGAVAVSVVGTEFDVIRQGESTRVSVAKGRVKVSWPGGQQLLSANESGWYSDAGGAMSAPTALVEQTAPAPSAQPSAVQAPKREDWREFADKGDFHKAYSLLQAAPNVQGVTDLLLAADACRLSGHPAQSVTYLKRVVSQHGGDPRAPLAAFTLGRVLMSQLGRPQEAAQAFAKVQALAPASSLAEDALAREVEAAHRAGDTGRARRLAERYLQRYPKGRRSTAVRHYGSLE